jgi:ribonuclease HII
LRKKLQQPQKNNDFLVEEHKAQSKGYRLIAGIDEAGRGPLAGPVVACSVVLKSYNFSARIDDSKKLQPIARQRACREIYSKAAVGIGIVAEDIIDKINIYKATILAMEISVFDLGVKPDFLLVDGNIRLKTDIGQQAVINGDQKSLSIACASIVAKVTRDRLLRFYDNIFPGYGFSQHKGYGTKKHISLISEKGFSAIHRHSFKIK